MYTLITLLTISALGLSLFAGIDYYLLQRNADILSRRKLLVWTMSTSIIIPILGYIIPCISPSISNQISDHIGQTLELPTFWVGSNDTIQTAVPHDLWQSYLALMLTSIWAMGVAYSLYQTLRSYIVVWRILHTSKLEHYYQGIAVYRLAAPENTGAFSFAGSIYLPHHLIADNDRIDYILRHEAAHILDGHHRERLGALLFKAIHWYLPTAQYLYQALDDTHEYIADRLTLSHNESNVKQYQYLLLSCATICHQYNITHAFNTNKQQLKKRILMMNKVNISSRPLKWVWLLCLPIASLTLWASNSLRATEQTKSQTHKQKQTKVSTLNSTPKSPQKDNPKTKQQQSEEPVFEVVEVAAKYPGGFTEMSKFLAQNIKYPVEAHKKGIQGRVIVQFIVEKNGDITQTKVVRSISPELDAEALRVVNIMPKWEAGTQQGKPVRTKFWLPIQFRLN